MLSGRSTAGRTPSGSSSRFEETIPTWSQNSGSRSGRSTRVRGEKSPDGSGHESIAASSWPPPRDNPAGLACPAVFRGEQPRGVQALWRVIDTPPYVVEG